MAVKNKSNYQSFQSSKGGRMTAIYFDMIDSKAWSELTGNDIKLYINMLRKYTATYNRGVLEKSNRDNIEMHREQYTKFMTKPTFEACIDHLIELGFVKVIEYKYQSGSRTVLIYGFNDMWRHYGSNKFHIKEEWRRAPNRNKEASKNISRGKKTTTTEVKNLPREHENSNFSR